jgi:integrase
MKSDAADPKQTEIGRFIAAYREYTRQDVSLAPNTKERRNTALKAVITTWPELPNLDIRRVSAAKCRAWAARALQEGTGFIAPNAKLKRPGMSTSAFNKAVDALRAVFAIACDQGLIAENPAARVAKAPAKRRWLDLPTMEQFQAVTQSIATSRSKWSADCTDMARLLAYSGVRLREGTALRWGQVNVAKNQLIVIGTKSETSRRVLPLFPALAALLAEIRGRRGEESPAAPILRVGSCRGALASACAAVGVPKMNHHALRHLFATRCIESGVDIPTVSRWLGHSDGGTLAMKTYGHLRQEHSQAQAAKVHF